MIYCIEDDSAIRGLMIYTLNTAGYDAAGFPDGESLFEALKKETPQLILLDIMLPGEDGLAILKRLRDDPPPGISRSLWRAPRARNTIG